MSDVKRLKLWVQKILPLVYDDSLSYYEVLAKSVNKINELVKSNNSLDTAWNEFQNTFSENLNDTVTDILTAWKTDGTLNTIIENLLHGIVNAVLLGADNTGNTDTGELINTLCNTFTGRIIYFPAGTYKINTPVIIRNDGDFKGNILKCDPDAKFVTDGVATMFTFGNGTQANTLEKFGFDGGYIDATNITSIAVLANDLEYSFIADNLVIRNLSNAIGIKIGTNINTSTQAMLKDITITGDGSVTSEGVIIFGTDNYLVNINIGRNKRNIVFSGGGNIVSNLHTWNYGEEYEALGITNPTSRITNYPSITINGSNVFNNVQVDNGTPAILVTNNAIQNTFCGVTFNYESDFPWAGDDDYCCCVYIHSANSILGNMIDLGDDIIFQPNTNNKVRLLKFAVYDKNNVYPFGIGWKARTNASPQMHSRFMICDFANTIYKKTKCLSGNFTVTDASKAALIGYIGANVLPSGCQYNFYDVNNNKAEINLTVDTDGNVTANSNIVKSFTAQSSLLIGTKTETINELTVIPVYIQYQYTGLKVYSLFVEPESVTDVFNSFIPNLTPTFIDAPTDVTKISLNS